MDALLHAVATDHLRPPLVVAAPAPSVAEVLAEQGHRIIDGPLSAVAPGTADAVVLLDDELSAAGEHAEELVAEAAAALVPGGLVLASAANRTHAVATDRDLDGVRGYSADDLSRTLGHRGFAVELLCAPGAASGLRSDAAGYDRDRDRHPELLGAATRVVALGRRYVDAADRERAFFASLPRKIVAAAVVCRDDHGRLLVVYDRFKRHWTIPGGVVDAEEDPRIGAAREAWEEAGIHVDVGRLLGVFASVWPDRLVLVYEADPREEIGAHSPTLTPVHPHEIGAVEWVALDEALDRIAPVVAAQVRRGLADPGGTWRQ